MFHSLNLFIKTYASLSSLVEYLFLPCSLLYGQTQPLWRSCKTVCLNYGFIVSLAHFCCWRHIEPVKVNYCNMFIFCQPFRRAVALAVSSHTVLTQATSAKITRPHIFIPVSRSLQFLTASRRVYPTSRTTTPWHSPLHSEQSQLCMRTKIQPRLGICVGESWVMIMLWIWVKTPK